MKKVLLSSIMMLALCVSFVSCKEAADKAKEATEAASDAAGDAVDAAGDAAGDVVDSAGEMASDVAGSIPSFESAAVADYVKSYDEFVEEYKVAAESKDMTAFSKLGTKGQELATKSQEVMKDLSAADSAKLTEYMTAKSKEMQELATKMMQ